MGEDALRKELVETVRAVVRSGAISMSGHGNASIKIPGRDEILYTAAGTLDGFDESGIARIAFDGTVLDGAVPPMAAAVIDMHTAIYQERPQAGCVIHTHSPYATAFAVANQPIECWTEGFGIFGLDDGVPVAGYGPRGSKESIDNIRQALRERTKAVLLANHGVLAWEQTAAATVQVGVLVEEAAQSALLAAQIGGARVIPPELLHATHDRHAAFHAAGEVHAPAPASGSR
ncbi:MAG: class II aldolase/adducin family protein [Candidatus Dormibacteraeota bacterium]|nr:class II aldolase/adducin family protein [Candidatus Dormibacteraeota bacterium]